MSEYQTVADIIAERDQLRARVVELERELAAAQAMESKRREAIAEAHDCSIDDDHRAARSILMHTLAIPADDSTLREMIEAARAEERERIATYVHDLAEINAARIARAIRAWSAT